MHVCISAYDAIIVILLCGKMTKGKKRKKSGSEKKGHTRSKIKMFKSRKGRT